MGRSGSFPDRSAFDRFGNLVRGSRARRRGRRRRSRHRGGRRLHAFVPRETRTRPSSGTTAAVCSRPCSDRFPAFRGTSIAAGDFERGRRCRPRVLGDALPRADRRLHRPQRRLGDVPPRRVPPGRSWPRTSSTSMATGTSISSTSDQASGTLLRLNDGMGGFAVSEPLPAFGPLYKIGPRDLDGDGDPDFIGIGPSVYSNVTRQIARGALARPGRFASLDVYGRPAATSSGRRAATRRSRPRPSAPCSSIPPPRSRSSREPSRDRDVELRRDRPEQSRADRAHALLAGADPVAAAPHQPRSHDDPGHLTG